MLAQYYKFHFVNNLGVDMDLSSNSANEIIDLDLMPWKFDSNGALTYSTEVNLTYTAADVADTNSAEFTAQNNSSNLYLGLHGFFRFQTDDATAAGTVDLYIEWSTDGGTTYPSDAADFDPEADLHRVATLAITGDGAGYVRATPISWE